MADGTLVANHKRVRAGVKSGRVRSGCVTCKIRHVKCDEKKPACLRCVDSGRVCDGYATTVQKGTWWTKSIATPNPGAFTTFRVMPSAMPGSTLKEHRMLSYYMERTIEDLAGYFETPFWGQCVLQIGHCEPAVRHALVALGAAHEGFGAGNGLPLAPDARDEVVAVRKYSLQQYNKAIRLLGQYLRVNHDRASHKVTLVCCLLFICFETMHGHYRGALRHLESGIGILQDWKESRSRKSSSTPTDPTESSHSNASTPIPPPRDDSIEEAILQLFARLDFQATAFLDTRPPRLATSLHLNPNSPGPQTFPSLTAAHHALESLNSTLSHFLTANFHLKLGRHSTFDDAPIPDSALEAHAALTGAYDAWSVAFKALIDAHGTTLSVRHLRAAAVLKLHRAVVDVLLRKAFLPDEAMAKFSSECAEMVTLARAILLGGGVGKSAFSCEMGVIAPLYFVAMQCRDPVVRGKAVEILRGCGRREGVWDGKMVAEVAERAYCVQGGGMVKGEGVADTEGFLDLARLCGVVLSGEEEEEAGRGKTGMNTALHGGRLRPDGLTSMTDARFEGNEQVSHPSIIDSAGLGGGVTSGSVEDGFSIKLGWFRMKC